MSKFNISKTFKSLSKAIGKHSPEILTGFGIAGMIATTVLAVKATPEAMFRIEERKDELETEKLPVGETVKTTWKCYAPAAATGVVSIACIIGGTSVSLRRNAALATAYKLSERARVEFADKVRETIGEKKAQKIQDEVAKERLEKASYNPGEVFITEKSGTLFYDNISGRYFKSDIEKIRRAINDLNYRMQTEMYISLNEFFDAIGLPNTSLGNELGWNIGNGLIQIEFSAQMAMDGSGHEGEPCVVLDYYLAPRYDFSKLM